MGYSNGGGCAVYAHTAFTSGTKMYPKVTAALAVAYYGATATASFSWLPQDGSNFIDLKIYLACADATVLYTDDAVRRDPLPSPPTQASPPAPRTACTIRPFRTTPRHSLSTRSTASTAASTMPSTVSTATAIATRTSSVETFTPKCPTTPTTPATSWLGPLRRRRRPRRRALPRLPRRPLCSSRRLRSPQAQQRRRLSIHGRGRQP